MWRVVSDIVLTPQLVKFLFLLEIFFLSFDCLGEYLLDEKNFWNKKEVSLVQISISLFF